MNDFQYRLDETDQIIKNGHTLSRLYMENPTVSPQIDIIV